VNVTLAPAGTFWLSGCDVIVGGSITNASV
jgi:hypothetical protein